MNNAADLHTALNTLIERKVFYIHARDATNGNDRSLVGGISQLIKTFCG